GPPQHATFKYVNPCHTCGRVGVYGGAVKSDRQSADQPLDRITATSTRSERQATGALGAAGRRLSDDDAMGVRPWCDLECLATAPASTAGAGSVMRLNSDSLLSSTHIC